MVVLVLGYALGIMLINYSQKTIKDEFEVRSKL